MTKLSDKEKAYVERAQREAEAARSHTEFADTMVGWDDAVVGAESAFPATVIGWDNPAAEHVESTAGDKWAYIAAMIETERAEAHALRARRRRIALSVVTAVSLVALVATLQLFTA